ncbi:MAG: hypothetical protein HN712_16145 [Gemmatimonadetes bacterium]|nr:hypothetical protein [Gemmatimonadota bacterium]MBT6149113.1 hypothetical protein [Gemmatimonadota bacterium]MBT7861846.1 hypothetical protein [Gemmatimonadota bacterium]
MSLSGLLLTVMPSVSQDLVFDTDDFSTWQHPVGLVNVADDGVTVRRFGTTFNAVADINDHSSTTIGNFGSRTARTPSSQFSADRIRDQDENTWWKPSAADPVQLWWIELDLGRAVVADKIRFRFPDEEGARPFEFFNVFASPGIPVFGSPTPLIVYTRVGRPISNNTERVVEFDLKSTGLRGASGAHLDTNSTMDFDVIRFIRFEATGATLDAALAEIEVDGVGYNLSSMVGSPLRRERGEPHWGGTTWTSKDRDCEGCGKGSGADEMLDEDLAFRTWTIEGSDKGDWRKSGVWHVVDFGSVFRANRVIFFPIHGGQSPVMYGFQRDKQGSWQNFDFLISDGSPSNSADLVTEGPYHYDLLSEIANGTNSNTDPRYRSHFGRYLFDLNFEPLDMRLFLWRVTKPEQFHRALQLFVFHAEGFPRQVELESEDVFLGGARSIRSIEWDADIPPGTRIEVDTQTGNGFDEITRYYLINGKEVTKAAYDAAKKRNRGDIIVFQVRDDTWSDWSDPHRFSGQDFQSPSPRTWLHTRVRLISEDPDVMPTLRSLRFIANAPVVSAGLTGTISPREAFVDSLQEFRYTILLEGTSGRDVGFNRVIVGIPPGVADVEFVGATIGGESVEAIPEMVADSLIITLPPPVVKRDSVEVMFRARLTETPTVFDALVLNSRQEDNQQGVVPAEFDAQQVFLPDAISSRKLVRSLNHTSTFTPNGDGINDLMELSFTIVKTDREPEVSIYTLAGQRLAQLESLSQQAGRARFEWNGEVDGSTVPPGVYILRIEVDTDARNERVHRTVHVAY